MNIIRAQEHIKYLSDLLNEYKKIKEYDDYLYYYFEILGAIDELNKEFKNVCNG